MGPRAGRPRPDDRLEREVLASLLVEELREVPRDVALRAPDERHTGEPLEDAVGDGAGAAKLLELPFLLDRAELLDRAARRHELEPAVPEHLVESVRQYALERDSPRQLVGELGDQVPLRQHRFHPVDLARGLDVAKVGEEADAVVLHEECAVRALEAGEVADVGRVGDEERLLEQLPQSCDAIVHAFSFRYWRASR